MLVTIIILSILVVILLFAIRNILLKVEKYEDISTNQQEYLLRISDFIKDSKMYLQKLDEKGVFQSDDEVGYFFEQMKNIQKELDRYMLVENYAQKKKQS
jgi:type II secretory pathway pseudopilin PulG